MVHMPLVYYCTQCAFAARDALNIQPLKIFAQKWQKSVSSFSVSATKKIHFHAHTKKINKNTHCYKLHRTIYVSVYIRTVIENRTSNLTSCGFRMMAIGYVS